MKPICVLCQRFMRPEKNGFPFIEGMPVGNQAPAGTAAPHMWRPYKLWIGDKWKCRGCGVEIIVGVGANRVAEHYEADFQERIQAYSATLQINDC